MKRMFALRLFHLFFAAFLLFFTGHLAQAQSTVEIMNSPAICAGNSVVLNLTNVTSPVSYSYAVGANTFNVTNETVSSTTLYINGVNPPVNTTFSLISFSDANGTVQITGSSSVPINIMPVAEINFFFPGPFLCLNSTANVIFSGTAGSNATYTWDFGGATVLSGTGAGPYIISFPTSGSKVITVQVTDNGCYDGLLSTKSIFPEVREPQPIYVNSTYDNIYPGCYTSLRAAGIASYNQWSPSASPVAPGLPTLTYPEVYVKPLTTTTYTITGIDYYGCPASADITVNVRPTSPTTSFSYPNTDYCTLPETSILPVLGSGSTSGIFTASSPGLNLTSTGIIQSGTSAAGTYTVFNAFPSVAPNNGGIGCPAIPSSAIVTIHEQPRITTFFYASTNLCRTSSPYSIAPTLNISGTPLFTASPAGLSIDANTGAINPLASTPGDYQVVLTVTGTGPCTSVTSTPVPIKITTLPVATFTYSSPAYCKNQTNPLPQMDANATIGIFSSPFMYIVAATGEIDLVSTTPGNYTVTNSIAAANGCPAVSASTTVTISSPVTAKTFEYLNAVGRGYKLCNSDGGSFNPYYGNSQGSIGTFSATPAGLNVNSGGSFSLSTATPGNVYTISHTVYAGAGCPNSVTTRVVTVGDVHPAMTNTTANACLGQPFSFPFASTPSLTQTIYNWSGPGETGSGMTHTKTFNSTGIVNYSVYAMYNGCTGNTSTLTVTVNPVPVVTSITDKIICEATALSVPLSSNMTGATLAWTSVVTSGTVTGLTNGSGSSITDILNGSGIVTYSVTASKNGCSSAVVSFQVTVNPKPVLTVTSPAQPFKVCRNTPFSYSFQKTPGVSYSVSFPDFQSTGFASTTNEDTYSLQTNTGGNITLNAIYSTTGCAAVADVKTVTVEAPVQTPTATNPSWCPHQTGPTTFATLTASGALPNQFYVWFNSSLVQVHTSNHLNNTYQIPSQTSSVYYVGVMDANGCIGNKTTVSYTVKPAPPTPVFNLALSPPICQYTEGTVLVDAVAGYSVSDVTVNYPAGTGTYGPTSNAQYMYSQIANWNKSGVITVRLTNSSTGCYSSSSTSITVIPAPEAPVASEPVWICGPGVGTLTASGIPAGNYEYRWYLYQRGGSVLGTGSSFTQNVSESTPYYVGIYNLDTGCESVRISSAINVLKLTAGTPSAVSFCPSDPVSLPFNICSAFNAGNTVLLQISDASGVFGTNPTILASTQQSAVGTYQLSATLPAVLAPGNNYKLRIATSSPSTILYVPGTISIGNCGSLLFDGTNDQVRISPTPLPFVATTGHFTIEANVSMSSSQPSTSPVIMSNSVNSNGFILSTANAGTTIAFRLNNQTYNVNGLSTLHDNQCHHIAVTRRHTPPSTNIIEIYLDGLLVGSYSSPLLTYTLTTPLIVGNYNVPNTGFQGSINFIRLWTRTLPQNELFLNRSSETTTSAAPGLSAFYKFNETSGQQLSDVMGGIGFLGTNSNIETEDPTFGNPSCTVVTSANKGLRFNNAGTNKVATVPLVTQNTLGTGDFTIECWVRMDATQVTTGAIPFISNRLAGNAANAMMFCSYNQGKQLLLQINGGNALSTQFSTIQGTGCHHVAVTRKGAVVKFYVDGNPIPSQYNAQGSNVSSTTNYTIGRDNTDGRTLNGDINEVRIWKTERTAAEISANYSISLPPATIPTLVGYYMFKESAAVLLDQSVIANHGNLSTATRINASCFSSDRIAYNSSDEEALQDAAASDDTAGYSQILEVFPNPASDAVTVLFSDKSERVQSVSILDLMGTELENITLISDNAEPTIPLGKYSVGVYMLKVETVRGKIFYKKVVIGR